MPAIELHPYEPCTHPGRHGYGADHEMCEDCRLSAGATCHDATPESTACMACGYQPSETGAETADNAHDSLCCGTPVCTDPGACITHDEDPALVAQRERNERADLIAAVRGEVEAQAIVAERDDLDTFVYRLGGDGSRDLRVWFTREHVSGSTPDLHIVAVTANYAEPTGRIPSTSVYRVRRALFGIPSWVVTRTDNPIPIGSAPSLSHAVGAACGDLVARLVDLITPR